MTVIERTAYPRFNTHALNSHELLVLYTPTTEETHSHCQSVGIAEAGYDAVQIHKLGDNPAQALAFNPICAIL